MEDTHDSDSEPGGFALSVNLSPYVGAPARCRVWVRRRARKVSWLASRIRRVARLRGPMLLLVGDHILPPDEPVKVVRQDDMLSVVHVEHKWQDPFSFPDNEDTPNESSNGTSNSLNNPSVPETPVENPSFKLLKDKCAREPESITKFAVKPAEPALKRQYTTMIEETSSVTELVDHAALDNVKQRALALLQQVTGENEDVVDAPKKKRRRVRRRRPVRNENLSFDEPNASFEEPHCQSEKQNGFDSTPKSVVDLPSVQSRQDSDDDSDSPVNDAQDTALTSQMTQVAPSPTVQLSLVSTPSPTFLTCPPPPALVRNMTVARAPRVVRALSVEPIPKMDALVCRASSVH